MKYIMKFFGFTQLLFEHACHVIEVFRPESLYFMSIACTVYCALIYCLGEQMTVFELCVGEMFDKHARKRVNSLELIKVSRKNKVSVVYISSCSNTGSIRDDRYWISRKNSLELIKLSSIKLTNSTAKRTRLPVPNYLGTLQA